VLDAIGEGTERQRLHLGDGIQPGDPVCEDAWERRDFRDPAPVGFLVEFDGQGHGSSVVEGCPASGRFARGRVDRRGSEEAEGRHRAPSSRLTCSLILRCSLRLGGTPNAEAEQQRKEIERAKRAHN
jgi:hypothetical protein